LREPPPPSLQPLRPPPRPPAPPSAREKPSISIGTLEVRIVEPAASAALPPPRAPQKRGPAPGPRGVARPLGSYGFGQS
jgi:hypothetical protein